MAEVGQAGAGLLPWTAQWVSADLSGSHHYESAPIAEAIIEVRIEAAEPTSVAVLQEFAATLPSWQGAQIKPMMSGTIEIRDDGADASADVAGFQMLRADGARTLHLLPDRVAFGWNSNYADWESFTSEWWSVWRAFAELTKPTFVTRIATRFVNLIRVPKPQVEISDYLRTTVNISPVLPQAVRSLFMQVDVPLVPSGEIGVNVTSALAAVDDPNTSGLVLDLDTYDQRALIVDDDSDVELVERLQILRAAKNYVFEASITDATRSLIS